MKFSEKVKTTLWSIIDQMSTNLSQFIVNPEKDFSRKKKWNFSTLMKFIISMEGQSSKNELYKYFGYTLECPSNSSFNQRRAQIKADAFKYLFNTFTLNYNKAPKLFKGYKLLACDGSDINISHDPYDKETYIQRRNIKGYNQLHLNAAYDLMNRIYTNIVIQPARIKNENDAFCEMVDGYCGSEKTIFIADRGYESYNNLAHVIEKDAFFLFRCKDIDSNGIIASCKNKLPNKDEFDTNISLILTRKWKKEFVNNQDKYRYLKKGVTFDYIDLREHIFYNMNLRVLRFKISEENYECILTNLPQNEFSVKEIKELYAMRWKIENSFRELKYAVGLLGFHAKKREYIIQEIWSRLILYNFCAIITSYVKIKNKKCDKKHAYQINYTFAIHICKNFIRKKAEISPPDVEALISKEILPVRCGRHNPRKINHRNKAVYFLYRIA